MRARPGGLTGLGAGRQCAAMPTARIPGPPLPAAVQTLMYVSRPTAFLEWCHRRYGDVFVTKTVFIGDVVVLVRPEHVRELFTGDPENVRGGEANQILEPLLGPRSVMLLDGKEHARQRRL